MKKLLALLLAMITVLGMFAGCGEEKEPTQKDNNPIQIIIPGQDEEERTYDNIIQESVVAVAEAYYARRTYIQYEDNPLIKSGGQLRADRHKYSPEDATSQFTTYSNCATYTFDVYKEALNLDIVAWTCSRLQNASDMHVLTVNEKVAEGEKEAMIETIKEILQPGDIISYLKDNWGHAMLYIGYDEILHCSSNNGVGGSYNMATNSEVLDPAGGIYRMSVNEVLTGKHALVNMDKFCIVRPTVKYTDAQPTEKTLNRVENLKDIYVEKVSSHAVGMSAAQGDEVAFTFVLKNSRKSDATIVINDTVPTNTTYVSGADSVDGNTLKWTVTVPAAGKTEVSYTVKVNANAKTGDKIASTAYVGGVDVRCRDIYIGGSLTAEQQSKIYEEAAKISGDSVTGVALAKKIYAAAGIACDVGSESEIISSIFKTTTKAAGHYELNTSSVYMKMLAPTMYGGYLVYVNSDLYDGNRTKGPMMGQLMAGDIIVCKEGSTYNVFLFVGQNKAMSLNKGNVKILDLIGTRDALFSTIGHDQFVVIRPAMAE